jgi:hypothetical protein
MYQDNHGKYNPYLLRTGKKGKACETSGEVVDMGELISQRGMLCTSGPPLLRQQISCIMFEVHHWMVDCVYDILEVPSQKNAWCCHPWRLYKHRSHCHQSTSPQKHCKPDAFTEPIPREGSPCFFQSISLDNNYSNWAYFERQAHFEHGGWC